MKKHKNALCLVVALFALCLCMCSVNMAGGSQVGNPATVVGRVENTLQKPVPGAKVYLLTSQFIPSPPASDSTGDTLIGIIAIGQDTTQFTTVADSAGRFVFPKVPWASYNLFISDSSVAGVALKRNVAVDRGTVDLGREILRQPGIALFNIADSAFTSGCYLAVMGTPLCRAVDSPGLYSVIIPDDTVSVVYTTTTATVPFIKDSVRNISVHPGDTVDLTGIPPVLINGSLGYVTGGRAVPLSPGDTIVQRDSSLQFTVSGAYSNKNAFIDYQFYVSGDTTPPAMTSWIPVNLFLLNVISSGWYYISARVRIVLADTTLVSDWGPTCAIYIAKSGGAGSVSVPRVPSLVDTLRTGDTLIARFKTGGSVSTLGDTVEYRFKWIGDTTGYYVTPWSLDTIGTIVFHPNIYTCSIAAQARSSQDTSVVSPWSASDTLVLR